MLFDSDLMHLTNMHSSSPESSLLKHSLPTNENNPPETKRVRLSSASPDDDTIEKRISADFYTSIDQVRRDVDRLRRVLVNEKTEVLPNGNVPDGNRSSRSLRDAADKLTRILSSDEVEDGPQNSDSAGFIPTRRTGQVITLRSQTEKGTQQLFSGLQVDDKAEGPLVALDGRRLPNGFDLTDPATMDTGMLAPTRDRRLFGDVFRPHRNLKQLDMPRSSRTTVRGNVLGFSRESNLDKVATPNRTDYKVQQLPVNSWLDYNVSDQQTRRKLRGKSFAQGDLRAAMMASDLAAQDSEDASALFRKAFSSFAPTTDTSKAVISERDRDRHWWSKHGSGRLRSIFKPPASDIGPDIATDGLREASDHTFDEIVSSFQPDEAGDPSVSKEDPESVDEVLAEISELLETVHSYQHIRSLDTRAAIGASKPSSAEVDSYDLLRSQLAILIASLPPFAVAKLDGDKLQDLNISTNILVDTIDYRGTAQPDEYTLSRYRAAQPAAPVPARPQQPAAQPRPTYQTPSVPHYSINNNLQAYAQNLGVAAARYGQSANYSTPAPVQRPFATPFQQPASTYSQPTVQQFQRPSPATNGYGSYNGTSTNTSTSVTAAPQTGGTQTPSQPNYQQNAQNKMAYGINVNANTPAAAAGRSVSPGKPPQLQNGQTQGYYGQGQVQGQSQSPYQRPVVQQPEQQQVTGSGQVNGTPAPTPAGAS